MPRQYAANFEDILKRAGCHSLDSETLAVNCISDTMPTDDKRLCVQLYNSHVRVINQDEDLHHRAALVSELFPELDEEDIYRLLQKKAGQADPKGVAP